MADTDYSKIVNPGITTKLNLGALLNTLNPFSTIMKSKGDREYVPEFLLNMMAPSKIQSVDDKYSSDARALLVSKLLGSAAVGGGLAALLRTMLHNIKMDKINKTQITPGQDLGDIYERPSEQLITTPNKKKKAKKKLPMEEPIEKTAALGGLSTGENAALGVLPPALFLLAAMSMWQGVDKTYDKMESARLDKELRKNKNRLNQLIVERAALNRGFNPEQLEAPLEKTADYRSSASGSKSIDAFSAALLTVVLATSVVAGFAAEQKTNPTIIKAKAMKKGLEAYTKAKQSEDSTHSIAADQRLAAVMDSNLSGSAPVLDGNVAYKQVDI